MQAPPVSYQQLGTHTEMGEMYRGERRRETELERRRKEKKVNKTPDKTW